MKLYIVLASFILASISPVLHASQPAIIQQADSAYMSDNYTEAATLYQQALNNLGTSSDLYYNLGNALFRMGKPGQAIVAYERALRLTRPMTMPAQILSLSTHA